MGGEYISMCLYRCVIESKMDICVCADVWQIQCSEKAIGWIDVAFVLWKWTISKRIDGIIANSKQITQDTPQIVMLCGLKFDIMGKIDM